MSADQILSIIRKKGIVLEVQGNDIKCQAPTGTLTPDLIESMRSHKPEILTILTSFKQPKSGECENCPAAGLWDFKGPGSWCFHSAYFLGKTAKPVHCTAARKDCPLG